MPPSIDVLTSSSAPAWQTALMALKIPLQAHAFGMKQQCPWGCMEPRDRERQTASHDPRPKQPRLAPEGTRDALRNERRSPGALGRDPWIGLKVRKSLARVSPGLRPALTRPPCRARIGVGLARRTSAPGNRPRLLGLPSSTRNGRNCAPDSRQTHYFRSDHAEQRRIRHRWYPEL